MSAVVRRIGNFDKMMLLIGGMDGSVWVALSAA
jgi:hypothetical protein